MILTLVLAYFTARLLKATSVLAQSTDGLVKATDNLARIQIRPRLVLLYNPHHEGGRGHLLFDAANRGVGLAFNVKVSAKTPSGVFVVMELEGRDRDIILNGNAVYALPHTASGTELEVTFEYEDAEGHSYKDTSTTRAPKDLIHLPADSTTPTGLPD